MIINAVEPTSAILDWIQSGGVIGILAFIVATNGKLWVSRREYDSLKDRCERTEDQNVKWMETAFKATTIADQVSDIARQK